MAETRQNSKHQQYNGDQHPDLLKRNDLVLKRMCLWGISYAIMLVLFWLTKAPGV